MGELAPAAGLRSWPCCMPWHDAIAQSTSQHLCHRAGPPGVGVGVSVGVSHVGVGALFGRPQHAMACRRAGGPWARSARRARVAVAKISVHGRGHAAGADRG